MDTLRKLELLAEAAKYDVACTSSGSNRAGVKGQLGATKAAGLCHSFSADGRCITLLKVLLTNVCSCDCAYCVNRSSNDIPRAAFSPRELADLTVEFYRRNYIEGLFVSSGVLRSPDYTMELLIETARILREEKGFRGYIHAKSIPGASSDLVTRLGLLVDRMSVNIELPSQASLDLLAPQKAAASVVKPMKLIREGIEERSEEVRLARRTYLSNAGARFVPAGQSTQMIVGATPETDRHILRLTEAFYQQFKLKRVFYSAYLPVNDDARLPSVGTEVPLTREHRLYQADWLLRFYGFSAGELFAADDPNLELLVDPKASWALRNMELFPVDVNRATYDELLRVPGIGVRCAQRIVRARRERRLDFDCLKRLGVSLKRCGFFLTCSGRMALGFEPDPGKARRALESSTRASGAGRKNRKGLVEGQLQLFEDACQHARDPFAASRANGTLAYAAQQGLRGVEAGPLKQFAIGRTPSGLPAADTLIGQVA